MKNNTARQKYQNLVDRFILELEQEIKPWTKSWNLSNGLPKSAISGGEYSGINILSLIDSKFQSNEWLTAKQVESLGGTVRETEQNKPKDIYFLNDIKKKVEEKDESTGETKEVVKKYKLLKTYKVYNTEQVDGINFTKKQSSKPQNEKLLEVEQFITSLNINTLVGEPAYSPKKDTVFMPNINSFKNSENYYATYFHEITHWSGHKDRLNRDKHNSKYDDTYAYEELIAELGSAFLSARHNINIEDNQHTEYLHSWIKILKANPYILFSVSSQSSKATNYIHKVSRENQQQNKKTKTTAPKLK